MKTIEELNDELFCLKYELNTMAGYIVMHKLERWLPGYTDSETDFDHRQRYDWVNQFVHHKRVLDMACGTGLGSLIMASEGKAAHVLGCDIEADAIRYASIKHRHPNLTYACHDATTFRGKEKYDVVVSFETVEHIPSTGLYLETIKYHMKDDAIFIVSTPISDQDTNERPANSFHFREWGFKKFQEMIASSFQIENIYLQLHTVIPYGLLDRIRNKINPKIFLKGTTTLGQFNNQVQVCKLGKGLKGYQILICKKK